MIQKITTAAIVGALITGCGSPPDSVDGSETASPQVEEPSLHKSLLVLDSHLDTPALFHRDTYSFAERGSFAIDGTNVDLPRIRAGGLDGGFWVIFTRQGPLDEASYIDARTSALLRQMSIRELAARYSSEVELAFNADDADRIHEAGKVVVFQSMENAYPLGEDLSLLETFYVGGLRMLGPVHFSNNQFADSSTDSVVLYEGLSPLGEALVREANRLGIMLDASHASDAALIDMMRVSTTPIILSHSGPDGVYDHARNVPDELLIELAESGGVVHVNAFGGYLEELQQSPELKAAMDSLNAEFGSDLTALSPERAEEYRTARGKVFEEHPPPRSTFEKYLEHLFYVLDLVGPDHVGIGADWDGGGGVDGMEDVAAIPKVTAALIDAGYTEDDIEKIWSGNLLRLMREVEAARTTTLASPAIVR